MASVGIISSLNGITEEQKVLVRYFAQFIPPKADFHHGGCLGGDGFSHEIVLALNKSQNRSIHIWVHQPLDKRKTVAYPEDKPYITLVPPKEYPERHVDIVDQSNVILFVPENKLSDRSGVLDAEAYAAKLGKPSIILRPEGTYEIRRPMGLYSALAQHVYNLLPV